MVQDTLKTSSQEQNFVNNWMLFDTAVKPSGEILVRQM